MTMETLDAHAKPPPEIQSVYKQYQKKDMRFVANDANANLSCDSEIRNVLSISTLEPSRTSIELHEVFERFSHNSAKCSLPFEHSDQIYEVPEIEGLFVYPSLLPPNVQLALLDKLLHRDLADPRHRTNVHLHYHIPRPSDYGQKSTESYFHHSAGSSSFKPLDPGLHRPMTIEQFLEKKLRWVTLGGQYDWTRKRYPSDDPPQFPSDLKALVEDIFPMKAEAAIVNLYSPGHTLSLHRDVSEECDRPLVSISLGCDAFFVVGLDDHDSTGQSRTAVLRLRSGDALLMSGKSRYAWHGVPKVLEGTCPTWMQNWPATTESEIEGPYQRWKGWMSRKRINLNVRQMFN